MNSNENGAINEFCRLCIELPHFLIMWLKITLLRKKKVLSYSSVPLSYKSKYYYSNFEYHIFSFRLVRHIVYLFVVCFCCCRFEIKWSPIAKQSRVIANNRWKDTVLLKLIEAISSVRCRDIDLNGVVYLIKAILNIGLECH